MADYISNYSGQEIDAWGGRITSAESNITNLQNNKQNKLSVSSTSVTGNGIQANLRKYGRVVLCSIQTNLSAAVAAGATILTLPTGYRPMLTIEVDEYYHTDAKRRFRFLTDGVFNCTAALTSGFQIRLSATWISDS